DDCIEGTFELSRARAECPHHTRNTSPACLGGRNLGRLETGDLPTALPKRYTEIATPASHVEQAARARECGERRSSHGPSVLPAEEHLGQALREPFRDGEGAVARGVERAEPIGRKI